MTAACRPKENQARASISLQPIKANQVKTWDAKLKGLWDISRGSQLPKLGGFLMSFLSSGVARKAFQVISAAVVLSSIIGISSVTAQAAGIVRVHDQIAQAKAKIFGEYPKAEVAWPEIIRPETVVTEAPAKVEAKATAKVETKTATPTPATVKAKPAKAKAPVEKKTEAPVEKVEEAAPVKAQEAQPTPAATVEAAAVAAPAPVATEAPAAIESTGDYWTDEILRLVNEARAAEGLSALTINSKAQEAAAIRVVELPNSPSPHLRPDGAQFYTVFAEVGLKPKTGGENYAIGTANAYSPEQIVTAWMNSPGHRKNIMNASYKQIGIGHAVIGDKEYFEQLFIG